jgi:hypothetical protein
MTVTHESYVNAIAELAISRLPAGPVRGLLSSIKLVYGAGETGVRGITYYNRWNRGDTGAVPFVEICAFGQESWVQIAGTTLHELGHVAAGFGAGHGKPWKEACEVLGLRRVKAAGTAYKLAMLEPSLREAIASLPRPNDGEPVKRLSGMGLPGSFVIRPCPAGIGTRGGKSRGTGSGSRLRLWQCDCGCKARVASDTFEATHTPCGTTFTLKG